MVRHYTVLLLYHYCTALSRTEFMLWRLCMKIDNDINLLLDDIAVGKHTVEQAIIVYLESLPGYKDMLHSPLTVKKYRACLMTDPNNFLNFVTEKGFSYIDSIEMDTLEFFKAYILNRVEVESARGYVTAVRQLFHYMYTIGWLQKDLSKAFKLPKKVGRKSVRTVPKEVLEMILQEDFGRNSFVISRNRLVAYLFGRLGLRPLEIPRLKTTCIHPYKDLAYLWPVIGKKEAERFVMMDEETIEVLKVFMIERAHFALHHKVKDETLLLSEVPRAGSYAISKAGVQAVLRRIKQELKLRGCLWDLNALNAQGLRRTATSDAYERAELLPINNPQLSICGQMGNTLQVSEKHYWKKSKRNAYMLAKGMKMINQYQEEGDEKRIHEEMKREFPETNFYRDFGLGI